jgi:hypothetical protein
VIDLAGKSTVLGYEVFVAEPLRLDARPELGLYA